MTVLVPQPLENRLRDVAQHTGVAVDALVEEALRQYLDALAITDVDPGDVAATQTALIDELEPIQPWDESDRAGS